MNRVHIAFHAILKFETQLPSLTRLIFRIIPPSRFFSNHRPRDINPRFPSNHLIASEIIVRDVVRIGGMNAASESYGVYVHLRARRRNTRDTMQTGGGYMQSSRAREA